MQQLITTTLKTKKQNMYSQETSFETMLSLAEDMGMKIIKLANGNAGLIGFDDISFKVCEMDNVKFVQAICDEHEIGELAQFVKIDGSENWAYIGAAYTEYSAQQQAEAIGDNYSVADSDNHEYTEYVANVTEKYGMDINDRIGNIEEIEEDVKNAGEQKSVIIEENENWETFEYFTIGMQERGDIKHYKYFKTVEKKCMQFSAGGKTFAIGILLKK